MKLLNMLKTKQKKLTLFNLISKIIQLYHKVLNMDHNQDYIV